VTAPNHALTGALIGLSVSNPALALPLAFLSHFIQDTVPHYDQDTPEVQRIGSKRLFYEQVVAGGAVCALVVLALSLTRPTHWLTAVGAAFLAASPDLFWIPRWLHVRKTGKDRKLSLFLRFHRSIQWKTGPGFLWVEAVWFVGASVLLWHYL